MPTDRPSSDDRAEMLDVAVADALSNGGRLQSRTGHYAVILYGSGNVLMHITFAILTLFVNGFFAFPWIVWANTIRERRVRLEIDEDGEVRRHA